jgi:hypothetical protein
VKRSAPLLEPLRARVLRGQLVVGMGVGSAMLGAVLSVALLMRLQPWFEALGPGVLTRGLQSLLARLWVLGVLPIVCIAAARVIDLKPRRTAVITALSGEALFVALDLLQGGLGGLFRSVTWVAVRVVTLAAGVVLAELAITRGRRAAQRAQEAATRQAEARRSQYDELAREAERLAELADRRAASAAEPTEPAPKPPEP